jgi:hypothetical protein
MGSVSFKIPHKQNGDMACLQMKGDSAYMKRYIDNEETNSMTSAR